MTTCGEIKRIGKEMVVVYFKVLS